MRSLAETALDDRRLSRCVQHGVGRGAVRRGGEGPKCDLRRERRVEDPRKDLAEARLRQKEGLAFARPREMRFKRASHSRMSDICTQGAAPVGASQCLHAGGLCLGHALLVHFDRAEPLQTAKEREYCRVCRSVQSPQSGGIELCAAAAVSTPHERLHARAKHEKCHSNQEKDAKCYIE